MVHALITCGEVVTLGNRRTIGPITTIQRWITNEVRIVRVVLVLSVHLAVDSADAVGIGTLHNLTSGVFIACHYLTLCSLWAERTVVGWIVGINETVWPTWITLQSVVVGILLTPEVPCSIDEACAICIVSTNQLALAGCCITLWEVAVICGTAGRYKVCWIKLWNTLVAR